MSLYLEIEMPSRNVQVITRTRRKRRKSVTELGSGVESAMLSTEITRKEFARICSRERSKLLEGGEGRGGERLVRVVTGSKFVVSIDRSVCQLFHSTRYVVSRPLLYRRPHYHIFVGRGETNGWTMADYAPVKLIYAACLCTRAKPDCSNKRTTSDLTDIIYTRLSIYVLACLCARTCTTTVITHVTPLYSFISFVFVRETVLTCVRIANNDRFVTHRGFIGSSTWSVIFFFLSFSLSHSLSFHSFLGR